MEALDVERLDALLALDDGSLVRELLALYRSEAPSRGDAIAEAVAGGDADALKAAAHRLRGASANVGAAWVAEIARELEELAERGDMQAAHERIPMLRKAMAETESAMSAYGEAAAG